jgi:hypothetical protein
MKSKLPVDEHLAEELSALADGEVDARSLDRWVRTLARDQEARARFARYRMISAQLASEEGAVVDASSIADRVASALADEPTVLAPRRRRSPLQLPRLALGAALAAGVAVLAVSVAPRFVAPVDDVPTLSPVNAPSYAFAPRLSAPAEGITMVALGATAQRPVMAHEVDTGGQRWKVLSPVMRDKLARYLVEHNEVAGQIATQQPSAHLSYITSHAQRP